ncbi:MAG: hypothetical protein OXD54_10110 [Candidatus Poribacteria bacterium]|nr:hypothetical protein [Candidatus Poribacteria bacterium]
MDAKQICLLINDEIPKERLFLSEKRDVHPNCNTSWRISPEPFWISQEELSWFEELGPHLLQFYRACNLLYSQSVRGIQPSWVAEYLDIGKPESVIQQGRMNRFKSHIPSVIRPDILPTSDDTRVITELDSIPGFIGATGCLARLYSKLGYNIIGGKDGMMNSYAEMIRALAKKDDPTLAIVVSDESEDYRPEMIWLANALSETGLRTAAVKPNEVIFTEEGLLVESQSGKMNVDVVYRFYEMFDLPNIPKAELIFYSAKKRTVVMTPPPKAHLEEKLYFALFHHPSLQSFWQRQLGKKTYLFLQETIPQTWILDPRPLPPHAVIPNLEIDNTPVTDWRQFSGVTQRQRELVIKPSGFSELAWGSRGVAIGHDLPTDEWEAVIENALTNFENTPYVLQEFHTAHRIRMQYYDFDSEEIQEMPSRPLLRPYYFVVGDSVKLGGIQAAVCPSDKKILHGMVDSIIVPCAKRESESSN